MSDSRKTKGGRVQSGALKQAARAHASVDYVGAENVGSENVGAENVSAEKVKEAGVTALKTVLKILDKWDCSSEQAQAILRLPKATYYRYKAKPELANITGDLLERLSYLLNIHASLRTVFSNPENLYGFMQMPNNNDYFNGESPIKVLESGSFASLYEVFKRVDALKGAS